MSDRQKFEKEEKEDSDMEQKQMEEELQWKMDEKQTCKWRKRLTAGKARLRTNKCTSQKKKSRAQVKEKGRKSNYQYHRVSAEHDRTHPYHHGAKTLIRTIHCRCELYLAIDNPDTYMES